MRVLTITQPWAELVASGAKEWETRSWTTSYRGLVAIHAAKGYPGYARDFASAEFTLGRLSKRIALGAIIAVAELVGVRRADEVALEVSALERLYGDYSPGRFAWRLANVRRLTEPIGARGALSLWTPEPETLALLTDPSRFETETSGLVRGQPDAVNQAPSPVALSQEDTKA